MAKPSERRQQRERRIGIIAVLAAAALAGLAVALRLYFEKLTVELDPTSLCPANEGPRGYVGILLDFSDPPNEIQREALLRELRDLESTIPAHHRVQVIAIRPSAAPGLPVPSFDRCKPPWGEDETGFTENPDLLRRRWREDYSRPLFDKLETAPNAASTPDSPLMKLIQSASVTAFPGRSNSAPRLLIIVSDFLEHTAGYSHYGGGAPRFRDFLQRSDAKKWHADLSGFDVRMLYLRRDGQDRVQTPAHLDFWKEFFVWSGVGSGSLQITQIPG